MIKQIDDPFRTYSKICKLRERYRKRCRHLLKLIEEAEKSGNNELLKDVQSTELLHRAISKSLFFLEGICCIRDSLEAVVLSNPDYDDDEKSMDQINVLQAIDIANHVLSEVEND